MTGAFHLSGLNGIYPRMTKKERCQEKLMSWPQLANKAGIQTRAFKLRGI